MITEKIDTYISTYKEGLINNIIPFWINHATDKEHGGYTFCLDRDGSVVDTDKGVWHQGRSTWMFATMYNQVEQRQEWLDAAIHGTNFMLEHCFDTDPEGDGRMWFTVTKEGKPIRKRRYVFSESFAAIAFAALYKATGNEMYKKKAVECFDVYYKYSTEPGLIAPKFTDERPTRGMGAPMIGIVTAREMHNNLGDASYLEKIDIWIDEIEKYFINEKDKAVMETVGPNGEILDHFDGRMLNPGHAIEGAWFIMNEAIERGNDERLIKLGTKMLDWMWEIGWDKEYGGITYFKDLKDKPIQEYWHDMKFWWPQNEAVIATIMAYRLTGDKKYEEWHDMIHEYAFSRFPDLKYGEWFGYLHRDGKISTQLKGNIWKGPFHIPRMYLKAWQTLEAIKKNS